MWDKDKKLTRQELIKWIKTNDKFYKFADLTGHTDKRLREIVEKIKREKGNQTSK